MLETEGYKMFCGAATWTPRNPNYPPKIITGTWLYRPDTACWYCNGTSYPAYSISNLMEV